MRTTFFETAYVPDRGGADLRGADLGRAVERAGSAEAEARCTLPIAAVDGSPPAADKVPPRLFEPLDDVKAERRLDDVGDLTGRERKRRVLERLDHLPVTE